MDAVEGQSQGGVFGVGDLPSALDKVNWAAFLLGGLWALLHGLWSWFAAILVLRFGLIAVGIAGRRAGLFDGGVSAQAFSLVSTILIWGVYALFAFKANRLAWDKARVRLSSSSGGTANSQITPSAYLRNQRTLLFLGAGIFVLGALLNVQSVIQGAIELVALLMSFAVVALMAIAAQMVAAIRRGRQGSS